MKKRMLTRNVTMAQAKLFGVKRYTSNVHSMDPQNPYMGRKKTKRGYGHTVNPAGTKLANTTTLGITNPGGGISKLLRMEQKLRRCTEEYRQKINH